MSYYVISLTVNIIITILIIIRLLMYRRTILDVLPKEHARHYVSIATIMVESAALYSVLALIFIITYAVNNPMNQIFLTAASCAQVCIPNSFSQIPVFIFEIANCWLFDHLSPC